MSRWHRAWLISALLALAACSRSHGAGKQANQESPPTDEAGGSGMAGGTAGSPPSRPSAGNGNDGGGRTSTEPQADAAVTPPVTAGTAAPRPPATNAARADVAAALARGPVVWIGQLRSFEPVACTPGSPMPIPDMFTFNPDGYFERVVIVAEGDPDTGALAVRITIGEGVAPASPADLPPLGADDPFWRCFFQFPTTGFEYTGLDPFLSSDRLRFALAPNELWHPWCESREFGCDGPCETFPPCFCGDGFCQPRFPYHIELCSFIVQEPRCECENGACRANLAQRYPVDLVVTEEGLEGVSFFGELRLRRVAP
jgi:hypothetical protein